MGLFHGSLSEIVERFGIQKMQTNSLKANVMYRLTANKELVSVSPENALTPTADE